MSRLRLYLKLGPDMKKKARQAHEQKCEQRRLFDLGGKGVLVI